MTRSVEPYAHEQLAKAEAVTLTMARRTHAAEEALHAAEREQEQTRAELGAANRDLDHARRERDAARAYGRPGSGPRPDAAQTLRDAAAGRREYLTNAPERYRELLELEIETIEACARVVDGDTGPLYTWLPSWLWTPEMHAVLNAADPAEMVPGPQTGTAP